MIEKAGALDVYFEEEIQVLVADSDRFSLPDLEDALDELEVEYSTIDEVETL